MDFVQARAPGRVNLIGEHTDYTGGFVLPCAIAYETTVSATRAGGAAVTAQSPFGTARFDLNELPQTRAGNWTDYLRGMLIELRASGVELCGCDLRITGSVPIGAGLSSSASFEIGVALALLALCEAHVDTGALARAAQRAENEHAGTHCGIMDQFTVLHAQAGYALMLDTRSLECDLVRVPPGAGIVICNTMVRHKLSTSEYNVRRSECEQAAAELRMRYSGVSELRDVSTEQLQAAQKAMPPVLYRRARHVVSENRRVRAAAEALRSNDIHEFGRLMNASHASLRDDFEVSSAELDVMTQLARELGAYGARMTGGGFGGCTVNLVDAARAADFRERITQAYARETGIRCETYDGTPAAGAAISAHG